ncbi:cell division protein FtsQ/DivIB [Niveibacterium terrae]|uniref:cell division protein FtsQ/DivIB n=1 Tax=Niveibacterium terrae TaxID=3373598 RepID=UPI003A8DA451
MAEHQPAFGRSGAAARGRVAARDTGFWHRPEWMNPVADALLLAASIALGYACVKLALAVPWFSFREVVVKTPLSQVTRAQLEYAARSGLRGNFFSVSLEDARGAFEKLPWVRHAEVRRVWPGALEVKLEEHVATAYWKTGDSGEMRLVNQYGEVFSAASNAKMPVFSGPEGGAARILTRYREFSTALSPLHQTLTEVTLSAREAWQLKLSDGMQLNLGRDQANAPLADRLSRFVAAWPGAKDKLSAPAVLADLRYPSGFAVRMSAAQQTSKGKQ